MLIPSGGFMIFERDPFDWSRISDWRDEGFLQTYLEKDNSFRIRAILSLQEFGKKGQPTLKELNKIWFLNPVMQKIEKGSPSFKISFQHEMGKYDRSLMVDINFTLSHKERKSSEIRGTETWKWKKGNFEWNLGRLRWRRNWKSEGFSTRICSC